MKGFILCLLQSIKRSAGLLILRTRCCLGHPMRPPETTPRPLGLKGEFRPSPLVASLSFSACQGSQGHSRSPRDIR